MNTGKEEFLALVQITRAIAGDEAVIEMLLGTIDQHITETSKIIATLSIENEALRDELLKIKLGYTE